MYADVRNILVGTRLDSRAIDVSAEPVVRVGDIPPLVGEREREDVVLAMASGVEVTGGFGAIPRCCGTNIPILPNDGWVRPVRLGPVGIKNLSSQQSASQKMCLKEMPTSRDQVHLHPNEAPPTPRGAVKTPSGSPEHRLTD